MKFGDAARRRRFADPARQQWYAFYRQVRFAFRVWGLSALGCFTEQISCWQAPAFLLSDEARRWFGELFKEYCTQHPPGPAAYPELPLPDAEIAVAAYFLWQREGCQAGRDREYWFRAREELKRKLNSCANQVPVVLAPRSERKSPTSALRSRPPTPPFSKACAPP
ncbi:MAG: DUF2934 domain-containing protein [Planctomycetes bacterium]|nr:DUF2934 domain-containing protein [Planctomycetota bacterium]